LPGQETLAQVYAANLAQSTSRTYRGTPSPAFTAPQAPPISEFPKFVPPIVQQTYNEALTAQAAAEPSTPAAASGGLRFAVGTPTVIVTFPNGSARLTRESRKIIHQVVERHRARGGTIRVVGHASSRTKNLPVERHKLVNFKISMARAQVIADALMRAGVKPSKIVVQARGDNDPLYNEAMPNGEAANRRAEIYLEN